MSPMESRSVTRMISSKSSSSTQSHVSDRHQNCHALRHLGLAVQQACSVGQSQLNFFVQNLFQPCCIRYLEWMQAEAAPRRRRSLHVVALEQEKKKEAIVKETLRPAVLEACMIQKDNQVEDDHRTHQNNCQDNETK